MENQLIRVPTEYVLPFSLVPDLGIPKQQTALFLMPGSYQDWRFKALAGLWNKYADKIFVAGTRGDPEYNADQMADMLGCDISQIEMQVFAKHTRDQMDWVSGKVLELHPKQVILSTAAYHLPRCTLTFVKSCLDRNIPRTFKLALLPTSDPSNPSQSFTADQIVGEIGRIPEYQAKKDVATLEEYVAFLK